MIEPNNKHAAKGKPHPAPYHTQLVSVIVPFYNVATYIDTCLTSLLRQTYTEIEIICVDDCSPDHSLAIVERHAANDNRIRIIRHSRNKGLGGARNTGIRHASGELIAFVDSDDYVDKDFISVLHDAIVENHADIAVCNIWRDDEGVISAFDTDYEDNCVSVSHGEVTAIEIADRFNPACWNKIFQRKLIVENQLSQPEGRYYEDVVFWLKAVFYSSKVCSVNHRLYYYRQRAGSIMNNLSLKHIKDRFAFISEIDSFVKDEVMPRYISQVPEITEQTLMLLIKHVRYGEILIDDAGLTDLDQMRMHYQDHITTFSNKHGWPAFAKVYELAKANSYLRAQLAQQEFLRQAATTSSASNTNSPMTLDLQHLMRKYLLPLSIAINIILLFLLSAA